MTEQREPQTTQFAHSYDPEKTLTVVQVFPGETHNEALSSVRANLGTCLCTVCNPPKGIPA